MWLQNRVSEILSSIYCKMKSVLTLYQSYHISDYIKLERQDFDP